MRLDLHFVTAEVVDEDMVEYLFRLQFGNGHSAAFAVLTSRAFDVTDVCLFKLLTSAAELGTKRRFDVTMISLKLIVFLVLVCLFLLLQ